MIQPATVTTHYPSHKLQQNIYHALTAFLCIFKNLMICKKILHSVPSHKRNQISFMSAIFIMILANEFGSWLSKLLLMFALPSSPTSLSSSSLSSSMQRSSYFFSLENNLKVECAIMVWLLVNHVLPKHFVYDYLFPYMNRAPFNFIYYVPHDWRKGLGLCSFIERYRKRCLHYFDAEYVDDYYYSYDRDYEYSEISMQDVAFISQNSILLPLLASTISSCSSTFTFTLLKSILLPSCDDEDDDSKTTTERRRNSTSSSSKGIHSMLSPVLYKMKLRFIAAFIYNVIVYECGSRFLIQWNGYQMIRMETLIAILFAMLPIHRYLVDKSGIVNQHSIFAEVTASLDIVPVNSTVEPIDSMTTTTATTVQKMVPSKPFSTMYATVIQTAYSIMSERRLLRSKTTAAYHEIVPETEDEEEGSGSKSIACS